MFMRSTVDEYQTKAAEISISKGVQSKGQRKRLLQYCIVQRYYLADIHTANTLAGRLFGVTAILYCIIVRKCYLLAIVGLLTHSSSTHLPSLGHYVPTPNHTFTLQVQGSVTTVFKVYYFPFTHGHVGHKLKKLVMRTSMPKSRRC